LFVKVHIITSRLQSIKQILNPHLWWIEL